MTLIGEQATFLANNIAINSNKQSELRQLNPRLYNLLYVIRTNCLFINTKG